MKVSAQGRAAIEAREGRRLLAYQDTMGVYTIGVGHTGRTAPPAVYAGMRITDAECDAYLAADLAPIEAAINGLKLPKPLTQNQYDACSSLAFNVGAHGFVGSSVVKRLQEGDVAGAADAFLLWNKPSVLKTRREGERAQFLTPDTSAANVAQATKPVAPAAAAPASSPAAKKAPSMTTAHPGATGAAAAPAKTSILSELETGAVNFGAGILNTFENIGSQLGTVASTVASGKTTTTDGQSLPSVTAGGNSLSAIQGAYNDITKLVSDAKSGNVIASVKDGVDLATQGYAVLSGWGINLTAVGPFISMLQKVEAFIPAI